MSGGENILEIRGLFKSFGSTRANRNVNFILKKGEIKGLIGENGSGKSTLLSQIAGIYRYDAGEMLLGGRPYVPSSPLDANKGRIAMVTQELGVVDTLPVAINVFLGRLDKFASRGGVNMKKLNRAVTQVFEDWDLPPVPLGAMISGMMIEQRKIVELARALSVGPDILLLDEITQSLSLNNRNKLYELIRKLKAMGKSVIVITHDIDEMLQISDSITVLRDGEVVGDVETSRTSADEIRYMMVGRQISGDYYRAAAKPDYSDEVVLTAENVTISGGNRGHFLRTAQGRDTRLLRAVRHGHPLVGKAVFRPVRKRRAAACAWGGRRGDHECPRRFAQPHGVRTQGQRQRGADDPREHFQQLHAAVAGRAQGAGRLPITLEAEEAVGRPGG
jgi:ribose transport system ATP-binding protein